MKEHFWSHCDLCDHEVVICGKCGNNTCNGGYGEVAGKKCNACPSAYDLYLGIQNSKKKQVQCSVCQLWMSPDQICDDAGCCNLYDDGEYGR